MAKKRADAVVSVSQPPGFAEAFKRLAAERTAADGRANRRRVWAQDLHEEAVRDLLLRLSDGEKITFIAAPFGRGLHRTMWLDRALLAQVREVARRRSVSMATVVLTACLGYL